MRPMTLADDDRYDAQIRDATEQGDPAGVIRSEMTVGECAAWIAAALERMQPGDVTEVTVRRGYV